MADEPQGPTPGGEPGAQSERTVPNYASQASIEAPTPAAPRGLISFLRDLFQRDYREVTVSSIIFGVIVGVVMNAAITYAGLKIGFTIVGSAIAAVLGFGVLRGLLRRGSILEVNIGQTIGSAVNTPNSGVIFTVPVLLLLGVPLVEQGAPNQNFWLLTLACVAGAILGGAFIVPLRKQMLDIERLRFPSATAVGAILKSPGAGARKSIVLLVGIVLSALIALPAALPNLKSLAEIDELDELVRAEKIEVADKIRTEIIAGWIEQESAPEEIVEHGRLLTELKAARQRRDQTEDPEAAAPIRARIRGLEAQLAESHEAARIALNDLHPHERYQIDYPDPLAEKAYLAASGDEAWTTLRDDLAGWAEDPLPGYSDLGWRLPRTEAPGADPVDFAYNGLGTTDPVLAEQVDRDRNGRADLILEDESFDLGRLLGLPAEMQLIFAIAPFALGAGYLTGRAGLFVLAGGVLAYLVLNPVLFSMGFMPESVSAAEAPAFGYGQINRPLGIGLLLGGALMGVLASAPAIKEAFKSIGAAGKAKAGADELGLGVLVAAALIAGVLLFVAADFTGGKPINLNDPVTGDSLVQTEAATTINGYAIGFESAETLETFENQWTDEQRREFLASISATKKGLLAGLNPHIRALIIAVIGALWIWFAGIIIAQCTGMTDWSPISGMALLTVVLVMILSGPGDVIGAVLIGAALCVAITCAADMMADLKTGYVVGAQPKRQQVVELVATGVGPLVTMGVLLLIAASNVEKYGVPLGPGTDTTAPQAQALEAIITGVQGGVLPYALYGLGAVVGGLLGLGSFAGLGVLVGLSMYLPMIYIATYGVGCLINIGVAKVKGKTWAEEWGVPLAAGFIVGDALLGLGVNMIVLLQG